jgi:hypothetical protein
MDTIYDPNRLNRLVPKHNPLAGVLSSEERQVTIQLFNAEHGRLLGCVSAGAPKDYLDRMHTLIRIAHKLGLNLNA